MAKQRECGLTSEQRKRARPYAREQLGDALYDKLSGDPNFDVMSMFLKNFPLLVAKKIEVMVPESGSFLDCGMNFDNVMWAWDEVETIHLTLKYGYRNIRHRMLYAEVPFPQMDGRVMSVLLESGTKESILAFLRHADIGPKLMTIVDGINEQLKLHD